MGLRGERSLLGRGSPEWAPPLGSAPSSVLTFYLGLLLRGQQTGPERLIVTNSQGCQQPHPGKARSWSGPRGRQLDAWVPPVGGPEPFCFQPLVGCDRLGWTPVKPAP